MSILTSADQSSSFISVSQLMIVRTSPLPLVRWLFPVKKASRSGTTAKTGEPPEQFQGAFESPASDHPLPRRIDSHPSRHYSQCCVCCTPFFFFFFHSSSLPDLLSEIKLTVGEVSHDLTQLVRTFRWVNCFTDFTVSNIGEVKSSNFCQDSEALENNHTIN